MTQDALGEPRFEPSPLVATLAAAYDTDRVGGPQDGALRYGDEKFTPVPDQPDAVAGRCMIDGRPWDDHKALPTATGPSCTGLAF